MPWQSAAHRPGVVTSRRCNRAAPGGHPTRTPPAVPAAGTAGSAGYFVVAAPDVTTGKVTPVSSSETAHSRCWTATSYDSGLEVTSRG